MDPPMNAIDGRGQKISDRNWSFIYFGDTVITFGFLECWLLPKGHVTGAIEPSDRVGNSPAM
jgi:hypothetical protein